MRTRLSTALLALVTCAALAAQTPVDPSQATFRAGTNYIRVDMYATRDGEPVLDLRPQEIELLEDGVPQSIETFEHVLVQAAGSEPPGRSPTTVAESREMAREARARVFVIFLDTYHTQLDGSSRMRLPLIRFLDRTIGPDDLVALMTPEMAATDISFSRKAAVIADIGNEAWWGRRGRVGSDPDRVEQMYWDCYALDRDGEALAAEMRDRRRERLTLEAIQALILHLGGVREERKAVLTVSEGWRLFRQNSSLARRLPGRTAALNPPAGVRGGQVTVVQGPDASALDLQTCEADRIDLALMDNSRRVRELTERANRANVSFYPVDPRGLTAFDAPIGPDRPPDPQEDRAGLDARRTSLRDLADLTDGTAVVNTNQVDAALARIAADLSSYYLLGYYSTNTRLDGRFREIRIRVTRSDVEIRARRGYRGLTAEELATAADPSGASAAPDSASPISVVVNPRAPFRIRTSVWNPAATGAGDGAAVWIVGELDYATRRELAWTSGARADVIVVSATGAEVTSTGIDLPAGEGGFTLRVPAGAVTPGEYAVRVRVSPAGGASLPLTDTVRLVVDDAASDLGEPILWRRGPSTGPRYLASADPRFQRSERIRLELPASAGGEATARALDRRGNPLPLPLQVSERTDADDGVRWIVVDATLAPLAPGEYGIEVSLGAARQTASFMMVP